MGFPGFRVASGRAQQRGSTHENDALDLWALRAEDPDKNVAGRIWSTEVVIGGEVDNRPYVSLRLIVSTSEPDFSLEPHVPGTVLQMIDAPGLIRGARRLTSTPVTVRTEHEAEDLCDHLEDPERRLPVFVVALPNSGGEEANPSTSNINHTRRGADGRRNFPTGDGRSRQSVVKRGDTGMEKAL